ncbi:hypothetical protein HJ019_16315 [Vibrio parahaemolyticus]|uniref:hypothetical protein n=1 Tax=Vibrio parahaemolyticus TaxID=670 RepID=UPI00046F995D|nr:hypothetical protein [Vibrio parahaemolyticus]MBE4430281.1 hypothetical protein [Vibrio parahaemolyticus]HCG5947906.1 hypothetical protein [Vibrio parahaemolyticus]HCG7038667.1 hypothetical protein [Vibrio parahaemolyticus]HCG8317854.1 hypothetical protein [Vibrio parahaemolyticus]
MGVITYKNLEKVRVNKSVSDDFLDFLVVNSDILISRSLINREFFEFNIDYLSIDGSKASISGWSVDTNYMLPPKAVLIFENNKLVKIVKSMGHRPDVSQYFNNYVDYVGFEVDFNYKINSEYEIVFIRPDDSVFFAHLNLA